MKTNLVKKGSEKNIEMFKMSNDELVKVTGGQLVQILMKDEDGNWVYVVVNRNRMSNGFSSYRND